MGWGEFSMRLLPWWAQHGLRILQAAAPWPHGATAPLCDLNAAWQPHPRGTCGWMSKLCGYCRTGLQEPLSCKPISGALLERAISQRNQDSQFIRHSRRVVRLPNCPCCHPLPRSLLSLLPWFPFCSTLRGPWVPAFLPHLQSSWWQWSC